MMRWRHKRYTDHGFMSSDWKTKMSNGGGDVRKIVRGGGGEVVVRGGVGEVVVRGGGGEVVGEVW